MKSFKLMLVAGLALGACGKRVKSSGGDIAVPTIVVEPVRPDPVVSIEAPIQCKLWANQSALPSLTQDGEDAQVGLEELAGLEESDQLQPFPALIGTNGESFTKDFSMRCVVKVTPEESGIHKLILTSDDSADLYINGFKVISDWSSHAMFTFSYDVLLFENTEYALTVSYLQTYGPKGLQLKIKLPSGVTQDL